MLATLVALSSLGWQNSAASQGRFSAAAERTVHEAVELSQSAVQAPVDFMQIVLGPVRDSYQLLPWDETPVQSPTGGKPGATASLLGDSALIRMTDTPDDKAVWKYRAEGGGNFRYGNATTNNVNAAVSLERRSSLSNALAKFGATYNQLNDAPANRRFFGDSTYDRFLRGRWLVYAKEELENDQVRRIDFRSVSSAGLGYRLIDSNTARWVARTGPTVTFLRQRPEGLDATNDTTAGWFAESELRRVIFDNSRLEWTASIFPNFASAQSFRVRNEVGLIFPIGSLKSCWNWKIGVRDEYTENPAPNTKAHDSEVYFSIVYSSQ